MGHPVNNISYVLNNWNYLKDQGFPFYAFFLFREQDTVFADFFRTRFELLDAHSADACMFFAIAAPPSDWSEGAQERDYWRHYMANADRGVGYTNNSVLEAARYFHLEEDHLPSIVIFRNLRHKDYITVQLRGLDTIELETFFYNLFSFFRLPAVREMRLWEVRLLIDFLPYSQRVTEEKLGQWVKAHHEDRQRQNNPVRLDNLDGANDRTTRIEDSYSIENRLRNMERYLENLTGQLRQFQEETREQFGRVNVQLDRTIQLLEGLSEKIEIVREPLIERYVQIEEEVDDPLERLSAREKLFEEFDEFLAGQAYRISRELQAAGSHFVLPIEMSGFEDILEPSSREQIMTAELMWQNLLNIPSKISVDYSVCAIGLWKALECETNRTFVDALRVHNNVSSPGYMSIGQPYSRKSSISEKGKLFPNSRPKDINITEVRNGYLSNLMLGAVAGLVDYGKSNSLQSVFNPINHLPNLSHQPITLFPDVAQNIRTVANRYRNAYAHLATMNRTICQDFRNFMFGARDTNPLHFTLRCKRELLKNRSI